MFPLKALLLYVTCEGKDMGVRTRVSLSWIVWQMTTLTLQIPPPPAPHILFLQPGFPCVPECVQNSLLSLQKTLGSGGPPADVEMRKKMVRSVNSKAVGGMQQKACSMCAKA